MSSGPFPSVGGNHQGVPLPPTSGDPVPSAPKFSPATSPQQLLVGYHHRLGGGGTCSPHGWPHAQAGLVDISIVQSKQMGKIMGNATIHSPSAADPS